MIRRLLTAVALLTLVAPVLADGDAGTESPFAFGAGAQRLSLGGADLTGTSAATAAYWNPSRLATAERIGITGFHMRPFASDVTYQYFGFVLPTLDFGSFGLGVFRLGVSGIERRDETNVLMGSFDDSRLAFYAAYGGRVSGYEVGVALLMEQHSIDEYKATSSPGINLSITRRWTIGLGNEFVLSANARNVVSPGMELAEENVQYPSGFDAGATLRLTPRSDWNHRLSLSARLDKVQSADSRLSAGLEMELAQMLSLRSGINAGDFSAGAGISYHAFEFDYALVGRDLGTLHMFSLTTNFGETVDDRRSRRVTEREAEFDRRMSDNLIERNRSTFDHLMTEAKTELDRGVLAEASRLLDRALFIARGSELDTLEVAQLLAATRTELETSQRQERHDRLLDSAGVRLTSGNYLAARQFATLALGEDINSVEAASILRQAERGLGAQAARDAQILNHLAQVDSLLSYGFIKEAVGAAQSLVDYADSYPEITTILRRVDFGRYQAESQEALDRNDQMSASAFVDSAQTLFPGHQWCHAMRARIDQFSAREQRPAPAAPKAVRAELSPELKRQIADDYREAQRGFESGDLETAVAKWESIERLSPDYRSVRQYLVNAYKYLGVELYGENQLTEAIAVWHKAAALDPDNNEIMAYIKRTEGEIKKLGELSYDL